MFKITIMVGGMLHIYNHGRTTVMETIIHTISPYFTTVAHGIWFCNWRGLGIQVDFQIHHNTICNVFGDHWDHIKVFWGLGEWKWKFWLGMSSLPIRLIINVWTKDKLNWLVNFVKNLCQMFLSISLIAFKKNQIKRSYGLEMEIC